MKVAVIHDWLTGMRGGERVLEAVLELFPDADLFTLVHVPGSVSPVIEQRRVTTSFIQKLPLAATKYRTYLPLFPIAVEGFDLEGYDLVISSSHCVAKGVITPPGALHVSYVHTPMRYVWDMFDEYFGPERTGPVTRTFIRAAAHYLRMWDAASSARVDAFMANSTYVARRIQKCYGRGAEVIHPPVDCSCFRLANGNGKPAAALNREKDFYLVVSAFATYKRVDLAVEAFRVNGRRLVVIGDGPDSVRLRKNTPPNIEFKGRLDDREVASYYSRCRALVMPGAEDFGITPLEAMASGRPVVSLGFGGVLDTVIPFGPSSNGRGTPTGVFFAEQTVDSLNDAIETLECNIDRFHPMTLREHAMRFDTMVFKDRFMEFICRKFSQVTGNHLWPRPVGAGRTLEHWQG